MRPYESEDSKYDQYKNQFLALPYPRERWFSSLFCIFSWQVPSVCLFFGIGPDAVCSRGVDLLENNPAMQ